MNKPLVSILMPVYNAGLFIEQSIEGVLGQQFTDFEFILVNDGSSDGTRQKIFSFTDPRIRYFENDSNKGIVFSLNKGLEVARGEYVVRTDADDIALPEMVQRLTAYMNNHPNCIACGANMKLIGGERIFVYPEEDEDLKIHTLSACPFSHSTVIFRLSSLRERNIFYDVSFIDAEDFALWSVLLPFGKFHNLQEVTLLYRESTSQVTAQIKYSRHREDSLRKIFGLHAKDYFKLTENEISTYVSFMEGKSTGSMIDLNSIGSLIVKLIKKNKTMLLFNHHKLKAILFIKWYSICYRFSGQTLKMMFVFLKLLLKGNYIGKSPYAISLLIKRII